jgi:chromosomal replication initiator protein
LKILKNLVPEVKELAYEIEKGGLKVVNKRMEEISIPGQLTLQELEVDKKTNLNPKYTFSNFIVGSFNELAYAAAIGCCKKSRPGLQPIFRLWWSRARKNSSFTSNRK